MINERRIVEDFSEQDIVEYNDFCQCAYSEDDMIPNVKKKTLIAKIIIKWQKKQVNNTEIKVKEEIVDSIQETMDWNEPNKKDEELPPVPLSEKSGEEVMDMKKKSYEELKIAAQEVKDDLFLSQEQTEEKKFNFVPKSEDAVECMARDIDFRIITAEDRKILIELFGDEAVDKAESLQIFANL